MKTLEEVVFEIIGERTLARLVARQERGLPLTHNIINRVLDEEKQRWCADQRNQRNLVN